MTSLISTHQIDFPLIVIYQKQIDMLCQQLEIVAESVIKVFPFMFVPFKQLLSYNALYLHCAYV